ncbi:GAF domain-containing protein [Desulfurispirillum indicum]|uniref:GAF domain protein n=1 Tax=Desulfurispirillum indicum (strain ATCC BAA-1389 / DSM 22839 / S5) TaxID=653733 RepID=E6W5G5_DESIS|nr:GAF domain-containing protein [Desulfurispirillum indicum]ADU64896.1 GAF domain protein [Desulfurispirillum indicum S5]UCZ56827.1 GAF domain-containing protein [Desulfurispirillum indicum]
MEMQQVTSLIDDVLKGRKTRKDLDEVADHGFRSALQKISFLVLEKQIAYRSLNDLRINYDKIINALSCAIVLLQSDRNFPTKEDAARHALEVVALEMPFHNMALFLCNEDSLEMISSYNREHQKISLPGKDTEPVTFAMGEGLTGWVAQHRETALLGDVTRDTRFTAKDALGTPINSLICTPLICRKELLGVLCFSHHIKGFFHEHDIRIFETLGEFMAYYLYHNVLIYNAQSSPGEDTGN